MEKWKKGKLRPQEETDGDPERSMKEENPETENRLNGKMKGSFCETRCNTDGWKPSRSRDWKTGFGVDGKAVCL